MGYLRDQKETDQMKSLSSYTKKNKYNCTIFKDYNVKNGDTKVALLSTPISFRIQT